MALVVNLLGGPGVGKSTISHGIMERLKMARILCEHVPEVAKDFVWEERDFTLTIQEYVFGKQARDVLRVDRKVDVVVTDSPILLSAIYAPSHYPQCFTDFILWRYRSLNTVTYFLKRVVEYDPIGRYQDEAGAREVDERILRFLLDNNLPFEFIDGNEHAAQLIYEDVKRKLSNVH